ncbi:hypothetical protein [Exiguobacterium flavidum]|uniref:hypothetical protein n=1 Tax=Exiguobacterium flavidum TaxID=2184695 RepID=UPI000DF7D4E8|nr:hypothetical protein [Exiguobacterium flavidum]
MRKKLRLSRRVMFATLALVLLASLAVLGGVGMERDVVILVSGVVALWVAMLAPLTVYTPNT